MNEATDMQTAPVLIGIGSNIDPEKNLLAAIQLLGEQVQILQKSTIWQTPAVGSSGPDYLNAAVLINSRLSLEKLSADILTKIESSLGRVRSSNKYMDRTIDLDILIYGSREMDPELWTQEHVAVPASEIYPDFVNQATGETLSMAAERLSGQSNLLARPDLSGPQGG